MQSEIRNHRCQMFILFVSSVAAEVFLCEEFVFNFMHRSIVSLLLCTHVRTLCFAFNSNNHKWTLCTFFMCMLVLSRLFEIKKY